MSGISVVRGIAITAPIIGRITMGRVEMRGQGDGAKAIPQKSDHFLITSRTQNADRSWQEHPLQSSLAKAKEKLKRIPVRIAFNDNRLNLHNSYSCFDPKTARVLCTGDGERAKRVTEEGVREIVCSRPEGCEFGTRHRCKSMSRIYLHVEGQTDALGYFVLRTTSWNTLKQVYGKLAQLHGLTGGRTAGIPMDLVVETMTTTQSFRRPFWYADLVPREGQTLLEAVKAGREWQKKLLDEGLSQEGLEATLIAGLENSDFADDIDDADEWFGEGDVIEQAAANVKREQQRSLLAVVGANGAAVETPAADSPARLPAVEDLATEAA